jgi:hypothetical protein
MFHRSKLTGGVISAAGVIFFAAAPALASTAVMSTGISGYAVVDGDGTLARGLNATSVIVEGIGIYDVVFNSDVSACAYHGNSGLSGIGGNPLPGYVSVSTMGSNPNAVHVETFNPSANFANLGFHLRVIC